eukprot:jgi/Orpsp1_1/1183154/evm.model.c7180000084107.1
MEVNILEENNVSTTTTITTLSSEENVNEEIVEDNNEKEKLEKIKVNEEQTNETNPIQEKNEGMDSKVRLLTYNIFMRPPPIHSFESDFKEDRIKLICKQFFQEYDVIAFQECFSFGSTRIDKIKDKAKKNGLIYFCNSKKKHSWNIGIDGGLCILSRFPVINKKQY